MVSNNKAIVRRFMEALGRGDAATLNQLMAPDIAAICTGTCIMSGTRSHADILAAAGMLGQMTKAGIQFKLLSLTAEEDRVACEAEGVSTLANGTAYNNQYHFLFFLRDGKIFKMREYLDTKLVDAVLGPMLQAAGKS